MMTNVVAPTRMAALLAVAPGTRAREGLHLNTPHLPSNARRWMPEPINRSVSHPR